MASVLIRNKSAHLLNRLEASISTRHRTRVFSSQSSQGDHGKDKNVNVSVALIGNVFEGISWKILKYCQAPTVLNNTGSNGGKVNYYYSLELISSHLDVIDQLSCIL